ncbi:MAG: hypothetical protein V4438_01940 [Patescibacteria group bacterium]
MKKLYQILPKNPYRRWLIFRRFGRSEKQDCYMQCVKVKEILDEDPDAMIIIATRFGMERESEMAYYLRTLKNLGADQDRIVEIPQGLETISQIKIGRDMAKESKAELYFIVSWVHWLRVKFFSRLYGIKAHSIAVGGMARPWDVLIEILFILIYPIFVIPPLRALFHGIAWLFRSIQKLASRSFKWLLWKCQIFHFAYSA